MRWDFINSFLKIKIILELSSLKFFAFGSFGLDNAFLPGTFT
ncbi:hypothetical protein BMETH_742_0 [methanotrophic bacterial endosymbiont of Bathymodiolus sp.]|nr:hypothetical protein BMETH_742_0 [methanotrophic bacterial endosymbiont of Bathymodiolus sp.]